jgi:hypothetical protein
MTCLAKGIDRGGADDGRARLHVRQRGLRDPEHGVDVGLERRIELLES